MKNLEERKISFIGGGNIAEVFIERLIKSGFAFQNNILVSDIKQKRLEELKNKYCVQVNQNNEEAAKFGDFIFIAVPPPQVKTVLSENCKMIRADQVLISLASAIPLWIFESVLCKDVATVRVIPNTPSQIGKGANPYCLGKHLTEHQIQDVQELLSVFGLAVKIDESQMNIATALSAVGPTYFFPAIKAMKDFALKNGMNEKEAVEIISQTISGTADLVKETGKDPDELKLMIGTRTIDEKAVKNTFTKAIEEAFSKVNYATQKLTE
jgi:pyrroline-5-carboxylate reductase